MVTDWSWRFYSFYNHKEEEETYSCWQCKYEKDDVCLKHGHSDIQPDVACEDFVEDKSKVAPW